MHTRAASYSPDVQALPAASTSTTASATTTGSSNHDEIQLHALNTLELSQAAHDVLLEVQKYRPKNTLRGYTSRQREFKVELYFVLLKHSTI
jgi:hypothetical protein